MQRRVVFARINRRLGQEPLEMRPFQEDMARLAASHETSHTQRAASSHPVRKWFAADMRLTPTEEFLVGTLGYSEEQTHVQFDQDSWSWIKGETRADDTGSEQTVVPFALDLRDGQRWIAFAPTGRMRPLQFASGFQRVLNEAVVRTGLLPVPWEVDLVTSEGRIEEWLTAHPGVYRLTRTVKFSNPGRDLDDDRAEMRALAARRKTEEFAAPPRKTLNTASEEFREKLAGTGEGNLDVILRARGASESSEQTFNSRNRADETVIDDFGADLEAGMDSVLRSLRDYVRVIKGQQERLPTERQEG